MRSIFPNPARSRAGFTILEVSAAVVIVAILAMLLFGVASRLPGAADRVQCTQNLKGIQIGLINYMEDKGYWPQQPRFTHKQTREYEDYWIETLKPYGVTEKMWQCPGIRRLGSITADGKPTRVNYSPTMFDEKPETPRKWPNMPWIVEIGNAHGHGPLLILQDGSVHDYDNYLLKFVK